MNILRMFILCLMTQSLLGNMSVVTKPSGKTGSLTVDQTNKLRVVKEDLNYHIQKNNFDAHIDVLYHIKNEDSKAFKGQLVFLYPKPKADQVKVLIDGKEVKKVLALENFKGQKRGFGAQANYFLTFELSLEAKEEKKVHVLYQQPAGFSQLKTTGGYAKEAHLVNSYRAHENQYLYRYYLYPIKSFLGGVGDINIRLKVPKKSRLGNKIKLVNNTISLRKKEEGEWFIYEGTFQGIPKDMLSFALEPVTHTCIGVTLGGAYYFLDATDSTNFALLGSLDYMQGRFQFSLGALYDFDEKLELYQEIKMFPAGKPVYVQKLFDYRLGLGLVEQIKPYTLIGFRVSAGFKFFGFPLELTYQGLPFNFKENFEFEWQHDLFLSIPISF